MAKKQQKPELTWIDKGTGAAHIDRKPGIQLSRLGQTQTIFAMLQFKKL